MTTKEESLENELQCNICLDLYKFPYTLECGHTFCKKCIESWKTKSNACPNCNRLLVLPRCVNVVVQSLVEKCLQFSYLEKEKTLFNNPPIHSHKSARQRTDLIPCPEDAICDKRESTFLSGSFSSSNTSNKLLTTLVKKSLREDYPPEFIELISEQNSIDDLFEAHFGNEFENELKENPQRTFHQRTVHRHGIKRFLSNCNFI